MFIAWVWNCVVKYFSICLVTVVTVFFLFFFLCCFFYIVYRHRWTKDYQSFYKLVITSDEVNTAHLPVLLHWAIWRFMLLITAIVPNEELRVCRTITKSCPWLIRGSIVVSQYRNSLPRDCSLRKSIRSFDTFATGLACVSLTAKYAKAVKFICKHADLPSSETGGK